MKHDDDDARIMTLSTTAADGTTRTSGPFSINDMKLATKALDAGLTADQVRAFGKLPKEPTPMFTKAETGEDVAENVAAAELRQLIERIERLEEEKKALQDDVREIFLEAKGRGYDTKALRAIIRLRKKDPNERQEEEALIELYMTALGMA